MSPRGAATTSRSSAATSASPTRQLAERVNRFGSALRDELGVRPEERVAAAAARHARRSRTRSSARSRSAPCRFPPTRCGSRPTTATSSTTRAPASRSSARSCCRSSTAINRADVPSLRACRGRRPDARRRPPIVRSDARRRARRSSSAEPTSRDAPAFWLYSSGSTGAPKGCVHLHHDMVDLRGALRQGRARHHRAAIAASASRSCSSPTASATRCTFRSRSARPASCCRARRLPANVYATIERHRPTLFFVGADRLRHAARARAATVRSVVGAAGASRRARRCRPASTSASSSASASTSSTASARPKCCTCSSPTGPARSGRARADRSSPATRRDPRRGRAAGAGRRDRQPAGSAATRPARAYWNQHEKTKETIEGDWIRTGDKYYAGRRRLLLVRRPQRRHAEGRRHVGQPDRGGERADRARRGAGVRRGRPRGSATAWSSRWRTWCCARRSSGDARAGHASCSSSCASSWPTTSGRAGWSSSPSCRRRRPASCSASSYVG